MNDTFFVYGRVHPSEYDWKGQFAGIANKIRTRPEAYIQLDVGKIMGLCSYIEELESRIASLEAALSLSPENVERYHQELELSDIDIRHVISGIRRRVGMEEKGVEG